MMIIYKQLKRNDENDQKQEYFAPVVEVLLLEMEQGLQQDRESTSTK